MPSKKLYITIEANIGTGKSTLLNLISFILEVFVSFTMILLYFKANYDFYLLYFLSIKYMFCIGKLMFSEEN